MGVELVEFEAVLLLLLSNSADNFRTILFDELLLDIGDLPTEAGEVVLEVVRSMAGEEEVDEVESVSLFLFLLKENRFVTTTSGFGDNTGGLLVLESDADVSMEVFTISTSLFEMGLEALPDS